MAIEVICSDSDCGFRVGDRYFAQKRRFTAGVCPRCARNVRIVDSSNLETITGAQMSATGEITVG